MTETLNPHRHRPVKKYVALQGDERDTCVLCGAAIRFVAQLFSWEEVDMSSRRIPVAHDDPPDITSLLGAKSESHVVYTIEYVAEPEDSNIAEILEKMRETGAAQVVGVRVARVDRQGR